MNVVAIICLWFLETCPLVLEANGKHYDPLFSLATFNFNEAGTSRICPFHKTFPKQTFHLRKVDRDTLVAYNPRATLWTYTWQIFVVLDILNSRYHSYISYRRAAIQLFNHCTIRSTLSSCCCTSSLCKTRMISSLYDSCASDKTTCMISASLFS